MRPHCADSPQHQSQGIRKSISRLVRGVDHSLLWIDRSPSNCHRGTHTGARSLSGGSAMPRCATYTFQDPTLYASAIRPANVGIFPTARGRFHATLTQVDFDRLWTQFANESLPRVAHSTLPNRYNIAFLADSNQPGAKYCGMEISPNAAVLGVPGSSRHIRSYAACRWATMSLTPDDLSVAGAVLTGRELRLGSAIRVLHPEPAHMAHLLRLHTATRQLAESVPEILKRSEVSNALEQELVHAMVTCLADDTGADTSAAWRQHSAIMKRFEDYLAANCDLPLYLPHICSATKASERTLRNCCQEHLGMGPLKYLWLRRMHIARRALIRQDPARVTVTQIATQYGFWHLGRFAVSYLRLFGESPSVTLHRPDDPKVSPKIIS